MFLSDSRLFLFNLPKPNMESVSKKSLDFTVCFSLCYHTAFIQQSSVSKVFQDPRFIQYLGLPLIIKLYVSNKYDKYPSFSAVGHFFQSFSVVGHFFALRGVGGGSISCPL